MEINSSLKLCFDDFRSVPFWRPFCTMSDGIAELLEGKCVLINNGSIQASSWLSDTRALYQASGVLKLLLSSHFTVYWELAIELMKTRILQCNVSFCMFPGSLNSLVLSWNVKNSSFSNGKSITSGNWILAKSVLYRFEGHFAPWVMA